MDQQERQLEKTRLAEILQQIEQQIRVSDQHSGNYRDTLQTALQDYWKSGSGNSIDEAQFVESISRQRALSAHVHHTASQLKKLLASPYFGRIDFAETSYPTEAIYIGVGSLADKDTGEFLIYDWRAPVSSMYYDYGRGQASYNCPAGKIAGVIT
ncbi:MAG: heavy metal resistance protein CzcA, partial [Sporomusa sp.]